MNKNFHLVRILNVTFSFDQNARNPVSADGTACTYLYVTTLTTFNIGLRSRYTRRLTLPLGRYLDRVLEHSSQATISSVPELFTLKKLAQHSEVRYYSL